MYYSAEHGYVDITMELRALGKVLVLHMGYKALFSAPFTQRRICNATCKLSQAYGNQLP